MKASTTLLEFAETALPLFGDSAREYDYFETLESFEKIEAGIEAKVRTREGESATMRVRFLAPEILRFQYLKDQEPPEDPEVHDAGEPKLQELLLSEYVDQHPLEPGARLVPALLVTASEQDPADAVVHFADEDGATDHDNCQKQGGLHRCPTRGRGRRILPRRAGASSAFY